MKEDDAKWPEKNKDGRQELEIRLGNEHISFEVWIDIICDPRCWYWDIESLTDRVTASRQQRSARWLRLRSLQIQKD